jgi:hypothetical protein
MQFFFFIFSFLLVFFICFFTISSFFISSFSSLLSVSVSSHPFTCPNQLQICRSSLATVTSCQGQYGVVPCSHLRAVSVAYLSINGIIWDIPVFRGKHRLSFEIYLLLFESRLRKLLWVFLCNCINPQEEYYLLGCDAV